MLERGAPRLSNLTPQDHHTPYIPAPRQRRTATFHFNSPHLTSALSSHPCQVGLLRSLKHHNIIRYLDSFLHGEELYIVLEWASKGDLKDLISSYKAKNQTLGEHLVWTYFSQVGTSTMWRPRALHGFPMPPPSHPLSSRPSPLAAPRPPQCAEAIRHMHEVRIMHRDLKPSNVFVMEDGRLKLGDLGLGRYLDLQSIMAFSQVCGWGVYCYDFLLLPITSYYS